MTTNGAVPSRCAPSALAADPLVLQLPTDPVEVGGARRAVHDYLHRLGVPAGVVDDMQLAVSELVTNAILHGRPGTLRLEVELSRPRGVILRVINDGPVAAIPPVEEWRPAHPLAISGRGLGIVRQLVDHAEVVGDEATATVVCHRSWGGDSA
jgi:anti-sigma regulatory factor (Ser/Thr protein kinase)